MNILRKLTLIRALLGLLLIIIVGFSLALVWGQLSIAVEEGKNSSKKGIKEVPVNYTNGFDYDCVKYKNGRISTDSVDGYSVKICTNVDTREVVGVGLGKSRAWADQAGNKDRAMLSKQVIALFEKEGNNPIN